MQGGGLRPPALDPHPEETAATFKTPQHLSARLGPGGCDENVRVAHKLHTQGGTTKNLNKGDHPETLS